MDFDVQNQENLTEDENQALEHLDGVDSSSEEVKQDIGFWEFFGLACLFTIPVIGFIACIVFMVKPKRQNMKIFARAMLAFIGVRLVSAVLVIFLTVSIIGNLFLPVINESLNTDFNNTYEVIDVAASLLSGNYSKAIKTFRPQLIDVFGEESAPIIDELSKSKYNALFEKIVKEDYDGVLEDINTHKYQELEETIGAEVFNFLKIEINSVAVGESSEIFDVLNQYLSILN